MMKVWDYNFFVIRWSTKDPRAGLSIIQSTWSELDATSKAFIAFINVEAMMTGISKAFRNDTEKEANLLNFVVERENKM